MRQHYQRYQQKTSITSKTIQKKTPNIKVLFVTYAILHSEVGQQCSVAKWLSVV